MIQITLAEAIDRLVAYGPSDALPAINAAETYLEKTALANSALRAIGQRNYAVPLDQPVDHDAATDDNAESGVVETAVTKEDAEQGESAGVIEKVRRRLR